MRVAVCAVAVVVVTAGFGCAPPCVEEGGRCVLRPEGGTLEIRSLDDWNPLFNGVTEIDGDLLVTGVVDDVEQSYGVNGTLANITGNVRIEDNPGLRSAAAFVAPDIGGSVTVANNPEVRTFTFEVDEEHVMDLELRDAPALTDLSLYASKAARVVIEDALALETFTVEVPEIEQYSLVRTGHSLASSTTVNVIGALTLAENPALRSTNTTSDVASVRSMDIHDNPALESIGVLLRASGLESARIVDNALVPTCEVRSLELHSGIEIEASGNDDDAPCALLLEMACDDELGITCTTDFDMQCVDGFCALP